MSYYYEKQNPTGNGKIKHNTIREPISTVLSNVPKPIEKPPMSDVTPRTTLMARLKLLII